MDGLGRRIRTARETAGLSRSKVARALEVAEFSVVRWATGQSAPSLATLRRIAAALGVTISTLVEEE